MQSKKGLRPDHQGSNTSFSGRQPTLPNTDSFQQGNSYYYQTPNIVMHNNAAAQALGSHPYPGARPRAHPVPSHNDRTSSPTPLPPRPSSSAERRAGRASQAVRLEPVMEGDSRLLREVNDPPPGDQPQRKVASPEASKQRSHYFEQAFRSPREAGVRQDEIRAQSMVLAEIKTNVMVKDEVAFMADLSALLTKRYQRPATSVSITLQHGVCMQFAGSFDSSYVMSIQALPSQVQTATNKRNIALIQQHLEQALRVPPARGLMRFVGVPEDCLGSHGKTVTGELAELVADDGAAAQTQKGVKGSKMVMTHHSDAAPATPTKTSHEMEVRDVVGLAPLPPLSQDTSMESTSLSLDPSLSPESQSSGNENAPEPPPKPLKPKKSVKFIQALFGKRSKPDAQG